MSDDNQPIRSQTHVSVGGKILTLVVAKADDGELVYALFGEGGAEIRTPPAAQPHPGASPSGRRPAPKVPDPYEMWREANEAHTGMVRS